MTRKLLLAEPQVAEDLADKLSHSTMVAKYDSDGEPEAWRIVNAFADLEGMFCRFLEERLPAILAAPADGSDVEDLLVDVAEDFRHMLYHFRDSHLFRTFIED